MYTGININYKPKLIPHPSKKISDQLLEVAESIADLNLPISIYVDLIQSIYELDKNIKKAYDKANPIYRKVHK